MNDLELATAAIDAVTARDREHLAELMADDVILQGPFPLGTKRGPEKAAKMLIQMAKLGVKLSAPTSIAGVTTSTVNSPAGAMVLTFSVSGGKLHRLNVTPPAA